MKVNILKCNIVAFDLRSDYRAVYAQFSIPKQILARRRNVHKFVWKNIDVQTFHSRVESTLNINVPITLHDLEGMLLRCKNETQKFSSSPPTPAPWQNPIFQTLIPERRGCRDKAQRAMLSKEMRFFFGGVAFHKNKVHEDHF